MLWIVHSNVKYTKLLLKCTFLIVTLWPVIFNKWLWIARVIIWLTCYDCFCLTMLKAQTLSLRDSESEFKKDCVTNHKPAGITWEQIFVNNDYLFWSLYFWIAFDYTLSHKGLQYHYTKYDFDSGPDNCQIIPSHV